MTEMDAMDRKLEKKRGITRKNIWYFLFGALMITVLLIIIFGDKSSKYNVDVSRITIEEVTRDVFQDYITVQGTVEPITTIYLDAVEGGRVEEILIDEGNMVKKGDVILRLSNDNLLLEITNNEAQVVRAINELRTARLQMDQTRLGYKQQIISADEIINRTFKNFRTPDRHITDIDGDMFVVYNKNVAQQYKNHTAHFFENMENISKKS